MKLKLYAYLAVCFCATATYAQQDYKLPFPADSRIEGKGLSCVTAVGTRPRTYQATDSLSAYLDFTAERSTPVRLGDTLTVNTDLDSPTRLYVDIDDNGQFDEGEMVSETGLFYADSLYTPGIRRARLSVGDNTQIADFLIDIHAETATLSTDGKNVRILGRTKFATHDATVSRTLGVPTSIASYMFLGLYAHPMVEGYEPDSVTIRHGYNLDEPQYVHGNKQWNEYKTTVGVYSGKTWVADGISVPYDNVSGNIRLTVDFHPSDNPSRQIVFDDEFNLPDGSLADNKYWRTSDRSGAAWNRYISSNYRVAHIEDGKLVCRAMKNPGLISDNAAFITGAKQTSGLFSFTNGYVEARALTTPHTGNFPAFWLMPEDNSGGWPKCGEIDIWETIDEQDRAWQTIHSNWSYTLGHTSDPQNGSNIACTQNGEYHCYGLLKQDERLTWYIDGEEVFSYEPSSDSTAIAEKQWPFNKKFYLIVNQSVGMGTWASNPDPDFVYATYFDWVRVYQTADEKAMDERSDAIESVQTQGTKNEAIYTLSGLQTPSFRHGVNIVRKGNGQIIKVMK